MHFPTLTTKRLTLRQLDYNDYQEIFFLRSDDAHNKYIDREKATDVEQAKAFIKKIIENEMIYWAICFNDSENLIGTIGLWNFSEDKTIAEVGYELNPSYQKRGIMNEALKSVIHYGFAELKLITLLAFSHKENNSSLRLLEKNNFKQDHSRTDVDNLNNIVYILNSK